MRRKKKKKRRRTIIEQIRELRMLIFVVFIEGRRDVILGGLFNRRKTR